VHATPRSFNAELGVPLVVLSCPDDANILVIELAARHPGEIAELCEIVRPEAGLITGIGITHLSEFGSREVIARTKSELLASLPASGVAVVPADDEYLPLLAGATSARMVTVGPGGHVSFGATSVDASGVTHGWIRVRGEELRVTLPVPGRALVRNAAMAVAMAVELGVGPGEAAERIANAATSSWRMQIVRCGELIVVNDAWNANPTSTASALRTVREMAAGAEMWAVLGGMAELGHAGPPAHARIGRLVRALGFTGLIAVSEAARPIAEAAGDIATMAASAEEAAAIVDSRIPDGAWVLVKASRVQRMEDFPSLLVRPREDV
jgi:UDP-N-acetylmuramoyl-tripeptide--D-alanyl-D-alanine ligase